MQSRRYIFIENACASKETDKLPNVAFSYKDWIAWIAMFGVEQLLLHSG